MSDKAPCFGGAPIIKRGGVIRMNLRNLIEMLENNPNVRSVTNPKLHNVFTDLKGETVQAVAMMVGDGFYRLEEEAKAEKLVGLAETLAHIYGAPVPKFNVGTVTFGGFGSYDHPTETITCRNTSIVTFLHEFRHHLQNTTEVRIVANTEFDAQAWACSIFFRACPELYRKAVANGRIMGVTSV